MRTLLLSWLVVAACSNVQGAAELDPSALTTAARVDQIAMFATGRRLPAEEARAIVGQLDAGTLTVEALAQRLVSGMDFARDVAPKMLLGYLGVAPYSFDIQALTPAQVDGVTVLYRGPSSAAASARKQPCKLAETDEVHPWWAMRTTVRVCRADHHPEVTRDSHGRYCHGASGYVIGTECGCGPNLIFCAADKEHKQRIMWSLRNETHGTIAHIVSNDLPLADVFTTRSSFRDRTAAWTYFRDQIINGVATAMPDLTDWPADGVWAERPELWPGQHAGIMTNPQLSYFSDGPRDRMRFFYERAWCQAPTSFGVEVERFRALVHGAKDLRYHQSRWQELASAPGCTSCHARLDYGMQYFLGYQDFMTAMGPTMSTSKAADMGRLYGDDIDDPRGEGQLTPHAFGTWLVSQPEFARCMVDHVNRHVFGGTASFEEREVMRAELERTGTLKALMARALVLYMRDRTRPAQVGDAVARVAPVAAGAETVSVPAPLGALLERHCRDCHDDGKLGFLARLDQVPRGRLIEMLDLAAFGLMPRGEHHLSDAERRVLVTQMIDALDLGADRAANARAYFLGDGFRGSRAHTIDTSRAAIADPVGYRPPKDMWPWTAESELDPAQLTVTPSLVMQLAQTAVETCRTVDASRREDCLTRALSPDLYLAP